MWASSFTIILMSNILYFSVDDCVLIGQIPLEFLKSLQGFLVVHFESYINRSISFFVDDREQILPTVGSQNDQAVNWIVVGAIVKDCVAVLFPMEEVASVAYQYFETFNMVATNCNEKGRIPMSINQFN